MDDPTRFGGPPPDKRHRPRPRHPLGPRPSDAPGGDSPTLPALGPALPPEIFVSAAPDDVIGNYRLVERIGMGGMGEVWIADQVRPVRRRVALKLIRSGMSTGQFIARFEAERQALALMDHPNIAKVLDAGATDRGLPYFVMEYVPGVPITQYCVENALDPRERLRLFAQACDGVQHAHEKAIIHRDIKPSNVLVTTIDGRPVPKIIDFGVAKALEQPLTDTAMYTQAGALVGTLEYMSPEQLDLSGNVDTRTDVYSLGVLLYELLVGALPFDVKDIPTTGLDEFRRKVREDEPVRPSTRVTRLGGAAAAGARAEQVAAAGWRRLLKGELDWIVMKALEKERARRYGTPRELAADIERYLHNEPVIAAPPGHVYRMRKFVRRHWAGVALASLGLVTILLTVGGLWYGLQRAHRAEADAQREAAKAKAVNSFLQDMLASASPEQTQGRELTVREMLDEAAAHGDSSLAGQWDLQAAVRATIGNTYEALGLFDKAAAHLEAALDLRKKHLSPDDREVAQSLHDLGKLRWEASDLPGAEKLMEQALAIYRRHPGDADQQIALCLNDLGVVYQSNGDLGKAETAFRSALDTQRKLHPGESTDVTDAMNNLAWVLRGEGHVDEAERILRDALATNRKLLGARHPSVLASEVNFAAALQQQREYKDAESLYREAIDGMRTVLGSDHPNTLRAQTALGEMYLDLGRGDDAEPVVNEALASAEKTLGPDHAVTIRLLADLGWVHRVRGDLAQSEADYREVLARRARTLGPDNPDTIRARWQLARALVDRGRCAEGERLAREALAASRRATPAGPENTSQSLLFLGTALLGQKKPADAERALRECVELRSTPPAAETWDTAYARNALGAALAAQGRFAEAESLLVASGEALAKLAAPHDRLREALSRVVAYYETREAADPEARSARRSAHWRDLLAKL
ncbi:MAG: tetratricopeptide repeat protein [bacterium]